MIEQYGRTFLERTQTTEIVVPENTWLEGAAHDILEMSRAYSSDGFVFLDNGDEVNALASFAYGSGWIDTGMKAGVLANNPMGIPPKGCDKDIPERLSEHLNEKTFRYKRMLRSALTSVCINSEPELPLYPAGKEICRIAHRYYTAGCIEIEENSLADGLALLSYAYGWIDAGVRTGILKVTKNRELFTI